MNFLAIAANLRSRAALHVLKECDVIFGCVDHDGPRLILTELAAAYEIPYIDIATEIFPPADNQFLRLWWTCDAYRPRDYCLFCASQIDAERAKQELESSDIRQLREKHGHGLGVENPSPSVLALNGILAHTAIIEFIALVERYARAQRHVTYKGLRSVMHVRKDEHQMDCYTCGVCAAWAIGLM